MTDLSANLSLPYLLPAQAQKHVTHNEALQLLDALVQLAVADRNLATPPASPVDGLRHIVPAGATGAWTGWDGSVAQWTGAWQRLEPQPGWLAFVVDEGLAVVWTGSAWVRTGVPENVSDAVFSLVHAADATRRAVLSLAGLTAGTTRSYSLPDVSGEVALLPGAQTFTGNKTFSAALAASGSLTASGTVTTSGTVATIGTATGTATYGIGTGATANALTKTVNLGTNGGAGSTTVVNVGSAAAGAGGTMVVNTPTVTFANAVTQVAMPQAALGAQTLGLGGATADATNRLALNAPAALLNHAGAGHQLKINKAAAADTASLMFQTGFSGRAEMGLAGNDAFSVKVSATGSGFADALTISPATARAEFAQPLLLPGQGAAPTAPAAGRLALYARSRAGAPWLEVMRPSGRDFPLQPHFGVNRIATWSPSTGATINAEGLPVSSTGTVSTPTLATTGLAASMRRWRLTSAAVVDSVADQRSQGWACWRGNAAGLGGFTCITRIALATLQATGMGFFGLYGSVGTLATTLTLAAVVNAIGIGFQRGTHANWQAVTNDATGAPTLTDLGAGFALGTGEVVTLYLWCPPQGGSVWLRLVNDNSGAVFEAEITTDLPATNQLLSPRLFMNTGATAAAVAFDCSGLYLETDY